MPTGGEWKDLLKAAASGDVYGVRYYLQRRVDPNFQHPEYFTCPIFEAIRGGHLTIVKILVEEGGADPNLMEELTDDRPIEVALAGGFHDIVDYLNTKLPPKARWNPRHILVVGSDKRIVSEICASLLGDGHRVAFTCESEQYGDKLVNELRKQTRNGKIECILGDVSTLQGSKKLALSIEEKFASVNTIIFDAAKWTIQKKNNLGLLEQGFMNNYIAPYIISNQLEPLLNTNGPSRILLLVSKFYTFGDEKRLISSPYRKTVNWFQAHLDTQKCCMLLMVHLASKFGGDSSVSVNAVHCNMIHGLLDQKISNYYVFLLIQGLVFVVHFLEITCFGSSSLLPFDPSNGPSWLASRPEMNGVQGKYFIGKMSQSIDMTSLDPISQKNLMNWTEDFLSRKDI